MGSARRPANTPGTGSVQGGHERRTNAERAKSPPPRHLVSLPPSRGSKNDAEEDAGGFAPGRAAPSRRMIRRPQPIRGSHASKHARGTINAMPMVHTQPGCLERTEPAAQSSAAPRRVRPGQPAIVAFESDRNGIANRFTILPPWLGRQRVNVTLRRTRDGRAHRIRVRVRDIFPGKNVVIVMDNLNIHSLALLNEAFEPAEVASRSAWRSTTRRSTAAGCTSPRSKSPSWPSCAWRGGFPTTWEAAAKPVPGRRSAIVKAYPSNGGSRQRIFASS